MMFILMLLLYLGGNIYLFVRTMQAISGVAVWAKIVVALLFWVVALLLFIAMRLRNVELPHAVGSAMFMVGSSWMVVVLYMVIFLLLTDIAHLVIPQFKGGYLLSVALILVLLGYGYINHRNPRIERIDIMLDKPIEGDSLRILAVSDIHLGEGTSKRDMRRYAEMIMREKADVIVIAGDLIDNSLVPLLRDRMQEELSMLSAPSGVYMVPGNHEYISGIETCGDFLSQSPIVLLRDSVVTLRGGVQIIGRDDRSNRRRRPLGELYARCDTLRPTILLDHQPYELAKTDTLGIDLQISGHTHRGQIFPLNLLVDAMYEQSHGYRRWSNSHIYVSSGLALWGPPFRIGTRGDMAVITLRGGGATTR